MSESVASVGYDGSAAEHGLQSLAATAKGVSSLVAGAFGGISFGILINEAKNFAFEVANDTAALHEMVTGMERLGATSDQVSRATDSATSMLLEYGLAQRETYDTTERLIAKTHDVEASLHNIGLTADVAARFFHGQMEPATDAVAAAMEGQSRKLGMLIPELKNLLTETHAIPGSAEAAHDAIEALVESAAGAGTTAKLETTIGQWHRLWTIMREGAKGGIGEQDDGLSSIGQLIRFLADQEENRAIDDLADKQLYDQGIRPNNTDSGTYATLLAQQEALIRLKRDQASQPEVGSNLVGASANELGFGGVPAGYHGEAASGKPPWMKFDESTGTWRDSRPPAHEERNEVAGGRIVGSQYQDQSGHWQTDKSGTVPVYPPAGPTPQFNPTGIRYEQRTEAGFSQSEIDSILAMEGSDPSEPGPAPSDTDPVSARKIRSMKEKHEARTKWDSLLQPSDSDFKEFMSKTDESGRTLNERYSQDNSQQLQDAKKVEEEWGHASDALAQNLQKAFQQGKGSAKDFADFLGQQLEQDVEKFASKLAATGIISILSSLASGGASSAAAGAAAAGSGGSGGSFMDAFTTIGSVAGAMQVNGAMRANR